MTVLLQSRVALVLGLVATLACSGGTDSPTAPPTASRIASVSSTTLSGIAGTAVVAPPSVRITSASGAGVGGVSVTFAVTAGGGSATGTSVTSGADGVATVGGWTLGTTVGANTMTATAAGLQDSPITFIATGTEGAPASVVFSRDSLLLDQWGDTLRVSATVRDANGNTISGATIAWTSPDTAVATVNAGLVRSVRTGRALIQASATVGTFPSVQATIPARVVKQRNIACTIPAATSRGTALGAPTYDAPDIQWSLPKPAWPGSRTLPLDYDADGDMDVVRLEYSFPGSNPYSGTVRVFKNDGGVLRDSSSVAMGANVVPDHPRDFEIADFTGDGLPELYVAQHGFDAVPFPGAPNLFLTRSGSTLVNTASTRFQGMSSAAFSHGSSAGDVDCDGDLDIVELNLTPTVGNALWMNNGSGSFSAATGRIPALVGVTAGQRWQEVAFIDIDADGDPDLYLGARSGTGWNEDLLLVNDGFGNFRASTTVTIPSPVFTTAHGINNAKAADFDGDGFRDLVLFEIPQPFSTNSALRLWRNRGDGRFTDVSSTWGLPAQCTGELVEPLWVVDLNEDAWPDVVVPNGCSELGGAALLINRGTRFDIVPTSSFVSWLSADGPTPIDLNRDGKLDLLFSDRGAEPVIVRRP